jgi:hypothetical protein
MCGTSNVSKLRPLVQRILAVQRECDTAFTLPSKGEVSSLEASREDILGSFQDIRTSLSVLKFDMCLADAGIVYLFAFLYAVFLGWLNQLVASNRPKRRAIPYFP